MESKRKPKELSDKKRKALFALILFSLTIPFFPMDYIGDPIWSAYALILVFGIIYVKWFMKD